jgi:outer membrane immunogenic protein
LAFRATFISGQRLRKFHLIKLWHESVSRGCVIDETSELPSVVQNPQPQDFRANDSHHVQNHSNLLLFRARNEKRAGAKLMKNGMRRILLSSAALLALFGSAQAADMATKMPVKAPPVSTPAYDWSGFYLGGYYGASWSHSRASTPLLSDPGAQAGDIDINSSSYTAGVTAGYNLQLSPQWLVGIEGDYGYLGGGQLFVDYDDIPVNAGEKNRWYATLRGRVGYVTGPSLIYVTGGVGFVHVTDTFGGSATQAALSSSTTTTGAAFGAGIETKLSRNWSAKTEFLYIDGGGDHTFASNPNGGFPTTTQFTHSYQVIKTGLNYRFDGNWDGLPFFNGGMLASNHNWNGFYVGGNAGIGTWLTHVHSLLPGGVGGDENVNGTGFAGGGQAGYNYMLWQKYLIGVEGDFGALAINHGVTDWNDAGTQPGDLITFSMKTNWYATLRGRIGTSTGPALLYLTGGAAWVHLQDGVVPVSPTDGAPLTSKTGTGFTWGGGTEVALDQHWSAKLESLYVNSGSSIHADFPPSSFVQFKERFVIVRFGLNYAFN